MIAYSIVPCGEGYRIHRATTTVESVMAYGKIRMRKVTRFDFEGAAVYPTRRAAQAVLCKLASEAEFVRPA
jgi:hypothetical protein